MPGFEGQRFQPEQHNKVAWFVVDTEHGKWGLPRQAVTLFLTEISAEQIATILNREWLDFLRNPT